MSDELVKRLRNDAFGGYCNKRNIKQAADRIEALKAQHANDCEMIARLREVLSGRTLDETHESFWKEKVRQLEAALAKADFLTDRINDWTPDNLTDESCTDWLGHVEPALAAYRQAREATR